MTTEDGRTAKSVWPTGAARRGAVLLLGLAGLGLSPAATAADVPGGSGTRVVLEKGWLGPTRTFERRGDSDWYRVTLDAGRDYAFHVKVPTTGPAAGRLNLRDLGGRVLKTAVSNAGNDGGFEFRPPGSGTRSYFVEFKEAGDAEATFPYSYWGGVTADARAGTGTLATIAVGQTKTGIVNWGSDADWFRTSLQAGKSYWIGAEGDDPYVELADSRGRVIAGRFGLPPLGGFTVPASGTYYVIVRDNSDFGRRYTLSPRTP